MFEFIIEIRIKDSMICAKQFSRLMGYVFIFNMFKCLAGNKSEHSPEAVFVYDGESAIFCFYYLHGRKAVFFEMCERRLDIFHNLWLENRAHFLQYKISGICFYLESFVNKAVMYRQDFFYLAD